MNKRLKIRVYRELAEKYCQGDGLRFICNDISELTGVKVDDVANLCPELWVFRHKKKIEQDAAWLTKYGDLAEMQVKVLILLFAIEMLKE